MQGSYTYEEITNAIEKAFLAGRDSAINTFPIWNFKNKEEIEQEVRDFIIEHIGQDTWPSELDHLYTPGKWNEKYKSNETTKIIDNRLSIIVISRRTNGERIFVCAIK